MVLVYCAVCLSSVKSSRQENKPVFFVVHTVRSQDHPIIHQSARFFRKNQDLLMIFISVSGLLKRQSVPAFGWWLVLISQLDGKQVKSPMVYSGSHPPLLPSIHPPVPLRQSFPNPSPRVNSVQQTAILQQ